MPEKQVFGTQKYKEHNLKETDMFRLAEDESNRVGDTSCSVARPCDTIQAEQLCLNTQSGP